MKKLLSVVLCVVMLVAVAVVPAAAADEATFEPSFYFLANGVPVADNVFAPEAGYAATTITLNTSDMPENYGYDVYFNADKSDSLTSVLNPVEATWLLGSSYGSRRDSTTVLTVPAGLPCGTYVATFTLKEYINMSPSREFDIAITIIIPCAHEHTTVQGATSATLFTPGFSGVTFCNDCKQIIDIGQEVPTVFSLSTLGQMFSGFSAMGQSFRTVITGLFKFVIPG